MTTRLQRHAAYVERLQNMSTLALVRERARSWWYHAELRERGQLEEARKREHKSTRDLIRGLRTAQKNGGYVSIAEYGASFHPHDDRRTTGINGDVYKELARRLGLLVVDKRPVAMTVSLSYNAPIPRIDASRADDPPYNGWKFCPLEYWIDYWAEHGAEIINDPRGES